MTNRKTKARRDVSIHPAGSIYWCDRNGVVHACEDPGLAPQPFPRAFQLWTLCNREVPPGEEFTQEERVKRVKATCEDCLRAELRRGRVKRGPGARPSARASRTRTTNR